MPEIDVHVQFDEALATAAREVLETMFFTTVLDEPPEEAPEPSTELHAKLSFHGDPSGNFWLGVPERTARTIASNFLGAEDESELSQEKVAGVICEMVNMICGAALSRIESHSVFRLDTPTLVDEAPQAEDGPNVLHCRLSLEEGDLQVFLQRKGDV